MKKGIYRSNRLLTGEKVVAVYHESEEPLYRHNCYIEALPPTRQPVEISSLIARSPVYAQEERKLPAMRRLEAVHRIASCIFPTPDFLLFEQKVSRMIRNGYLTRNPLQHEWIRQIRSGFPDLIKDVLQEGEPLPSLRSTAVSIAVIGPSGVGKSTMIDSVLGLYPQIIIHTEYNGTPFDQHQLVWLKLDCPFDGSLRGLCMGFFEAVDEAIGTRYAVKYNNSRRTANELLPVIATLAASLGLGVLVIDEIQRLSEAASGGAQKMLNFFVQLTNTIGVPVILVGTYKALSLFTSELAMGRRAAGQGDIIISNMRQDEYWEHFVSRLWKYQWTNEPTPLDPKLSEAIYDESQGIVDIAIKLYMLTQWSLIGESDERITPRHIKDTARDNFHTVRPILTALRERDIEALTKIPDVIPMATELDKLCSLAVKRVAFSGMVDTLASNEGQENLADIDELMESPESQITSMLICAGHSAKQAQDWAHQAVQRFATDSDIKSATSEAFRLAAESLIEEAPKPSTVQWIKRNAAKVIPLSGDLREIAKPALKKKLSVYDALKDAGVIRLATEFIDSAVA